MALPVQTITDFRVQAAADVAANLLADRAVQAEYTTSDGLVTGDVDVVVSDLPLERVGPGRFARAAGGSGAGQLGSTHERRVRWIMVAGVGPDVVVPPGARLVGRLLVELLPGDRFLVPGSCVGKPGSESVMLRVAAKPRFTEGHWTAEVA